MNTIWLNAPAKINLGLDVIRKRSDGYHEVKMIMQSIRLFDRLTITKSKKSGIRLKTNLKFLPCDKNNLVYRSAKMICEEFHIKDGLDIQLEKRIPVAAGMAGGSTDAASCLIALNKLYDLGLSKAELMDRGVKYGADIPYCIMKGTALSEGIGEILTPLPPAPDAHVLIVKPGIHVSTKSVYTSLNLNKHTKHPDIDAQIQAIKNDDIYDLAANMGNILEDVTIPKHPEIAIIKETMMDNGALGALMSGSGPTVFGLFDNEDECEEAKLQCKNLPHNCFAFRTNFYRM